LLEAVVSQHVFNIERIFMQRKGEIARRRPKEYLETTGSKASIALVFTSYLNIDRPGRREAIYGGIGVPGFQQHKGQ